MNESSNSLSTRREFIKTTGRIAAASALAGVALPSVHAAGSDMIRVALIGCGGRGTGAANDALNSQGGAVKLVAMADVFHDRLNNSYGGLREHGEKVDVPEERKFIGFDGYKKAIALADVAILATSPGFRPVHFEEAVRQGLGASEVSVVSAYWAARKGR